MIKLSPSDPHHWSPIAAVDRYLRDRFAVGTVLDIGPGHAPLPWATHAVDFADPDPRLLPKDIHFTKMDVTASRLPFADKEVDFVYARHILEDMFDPFSLLREMERVAKAGYIETPSPCCEIVRGVDGGAPDWRGYHHHRFIVWSHQGQLRFVSKYPLIEYLGFPEAEEIAMASALKRGARYWNTFYLWEDRINLKHRQSPLDFDIPRGYGPMLLEAARQSIASADEFFARGILDQSETVPQLQRAYG